MFLQLNLVLVCPNSQSNLRMHLNNLEVHKVKSISHIPRLAATTDIPNFLAHLPSPFFCSFLFLIFSTIYPDQLFSLLYFTTKIWVKTHLQARYIAWRSYVGFQEPSTITTRLAAWRLIPKDPALVEIRVHFTLLFVGSLNLSTSFCLSELSVLPSSLYGISKKIEFRN